MRITLTSITTSNRISWIDDAKMFAMLCVVLSHCLDQYMSADTSYKDVVHEFIIAFNMQMFMALAGYTSFKSLTAITSWSKYWHYVLKNAIHLLLPCISFGIVTAIINQKVSSIFYIEWFLSMLFKYLIIFALTNWLFHLICKKIDNKEKKERLQTLGIYSVFAVIMVLIPSSKLTEFVSFFMLGIVAKKYDLLKQFHSLGIYKLVVITTLLLFTIWFAFGISRHNNFYCNPIHDLVSEGIYDIIIARQFCGLACVIVFTYVIYLLSNGYTLFSYCGSKTLGIYLIHNFYLRTLLPRLGLNDLNWPETILLTIALTCLTLTTIFILEQNRYTSFLYLGNRKIVSNNKNIS